jgi:hypothetical protein
MAKPLAVLVRNQVSKAMGQVNPGIEHYNAFKVHDADRGRARPGIFRFSWGCPVEGKVTHTMSNLNDDVEVIS